VGIGTGIGRGHPHYLDCVGQELTKRLPAEDLRWTSVFELSHGVARLGWRVLALSYRLSAQSPLATTVYNSLRRAQAQSATSGLALRLLGRDLRRILQGFPGICLVEHQLVARMLADVGRVWFLHADVAAPKECAGTGAERVFVPLEYTEQRLIACGCPSDRIVRTGLMIEPELVAAAQDTFLRRLSRLEGAPPLTIAFFSSGAYPKPHVRKIMLGIASVLRAGMRAVFFCGTDARFFGRVERLTRDWPCRRALMGPECGDVVRGISRLRSDSDWQLGLVHRSDRRADTAAAVALLPEVDAFVAPSHERTNWALGLGLPLFALFPLIGTHAPMNFDFASEQNVVHPLRTDRDARTLGDTIVKLRAQGILATMCKLGFGRFPIEGAARVASAVVEAGS
jgi:hypothetical protein